MNLRFFGYALALATACKTPRPETKKTEPEIVAHKDEAEHEELPKRVKIADEVVKSAKIATALIDKEAIRTTLALPGEITVDPDKSARIASPAAGRIVQVTFKEGQRVEKGALLATVRVPDVAKVRAIYTSSNARLVSARANEGRLTELAKSGMASAQELANAKAEVEALQAESQASAAQLGSLGAGGGGDLALRAPIAGTVLSRSAVMGQPLTAEEVIATIGDLSEVWFLARVFEKDLEQLQIGLGAEVELNAFGTRRFQGSVEYISKQVDPLARTLTARVRLRNPDEALRVGLYGAAHVAVGHANDTPVLVVPRSALVDIAGKPVVFVQQADGDFELHEVTLGRANPGKVEVLSGLRVGERVVVEGAFAVKSIVLKSTLAEDE